MIFLFLRSRSAAAVHVRRLRALVPEPAGHPSSDTQRRAERPGSRKADGTKKPRSR
ncbi:hypothetical protein [Variovorax paradoxus]|uniref:hypothetical protein n=1 Tax=Variovorax paradoxus TaxID=34073 RepID=UPI00193343BE|nr:hypothetical protein INQ48_37650 [Variovorax paradoxus]